MEQRDQLQRPLLVARLSVLEEPRVIDQLEHRAHRAGHTLSDEVRQALREYLAK